jgi:5S rRNA maturation endonuclease (ribonuclease M5)
VSAYERLLDALRDHGSTVNDNGHGKAQAQCPAHDDGRASLAITRIDGSVLLHCHAACDTADVLAALKLELRDLYDKPAGAVYHYPDGRRVHRKPDKTFRQSGNTKGNSLFHADCVGSAELVYVCEGEKDVLAVESVDAAAVCSAMGAGKAARFDWNPLRGKNVVIIADKDEAGRKHAQRIAELLHGIAASVRIAESAVGKDVADHIAAGKTLDELLGIVAEDAAELLDELLAALTRYVVFPDEHAAGAVALWIATTHALPAFECAPRLVATSPDKRCGKTRLLDIITGTCHRPLATSNATVAAIFRSIVGDHPPTLVIDEADTLFGSKKVAENNEDLRALLNAGHQRGRPALRCVGPMQTPTEFNTFAMAALAGIGTMPDTITDRAINITMRRRAAGEHVSQFRSRRDGPKLVHLRERLAEWAGAHSDELRAAEPDMPVEDRAADTWEPLIAVADTAGGHWPETARTACKALVDAADEADEERSLSTKLLADIKTVFIAEGVTFLPSAELVAGLRRIEDAPWDDFELTTRKLAYRLREFGIKPGRAERNTIRGYSIEALSDAFARYIRPHPSSTSSPQINPQKPEDGSKSEDGSIRPHKNIRPHETAGQDALWTGWTDEDGCVPENGQACCRGCGTPLTRPESQARGMCAECSLIANVPERGAS